MVAKKRQHFIPQFYLKAFRDVSRPEEKRPFVWVYNKGQKYPRRCPVKSIGFKNYCYSVKTPREENDTVIDDFLEKIEQATAPCWKKLEHSYQELPKRERAVIAQFLASMHLRVPITEETADATFDRMFRQILQFTADHFEDLNEKERKFVGMSKTELGHAAQNGSLHYGFVRDRLITSIISLVPEIAEVIYKMRWAFLHAPENCAFITSDRPVVLVNPLLPPEEGEAGFGIAEVGVTFPATSRLCMLLTWQGPIGQIDVDEKLVYAINCRTASYADEAIYSSRKMPWLE